MVPILINNVSKPSYDLKFTVQNHNHVCTSLIESITDSMDMNLSKLWEIVEDRGAWCAAVYAVKKSWT